MVSFENFMNLPMKTFNENFIESLQSEIIWNSFEGILWAIFHIQVFGVIGMNGESANLLQYHGLDHFIFSSTLREVFYT